MEFQKIWIAQCKAAHRIRQRFGLSSALDYLVGEKLLQFAAEADRHPEFAEELPRFQAAVCGMFNSYEIAGYLTTVKPKERRLLRSLLLVNS